MPRRPRLESPTDYYHVMVRGNNKEKILKTSGQKGYFLNCLKELVEAGKFELAAYCIMDNHVHLIVKSKLDDLSSTMKKLNTKYAMAINYQQDRIGHVFQDRFKSEIIDKDSYLLNVIRYVHNNPVRAKIVNTPKEYKWSSYNDYIEVNKIIDENQKDFVLGCFNNIERFIEYHSIIDNQEYLDTKEEIEEYRLEMAQNIISNYFKENGIYSVVEITKRPHHLDEIIKKLLENTKLTHRQIAKLLYIHNSIVHQINLEIKKQRGQSPLL